MKQNAKLQILNTKISVGLMNLVTAILVESALALCRR